MLLDEDVELSLLEGFLGELVGKRNEWRVHWKVRPLSKRRCRSWQDSRLESKAAGVAAEIRDCVPMARAVGLQPNRRLFRMATNCTT